MKYLITILAVLFFSQIGFGQWDIMIGDGKQVAINNQRDDLIDIAVRQEDGKYIVEVKLAEGVTYFSGDSGFNITGSDGITVTPTDDNMLRIEYVGESEIQRASRWENHPDSSIIKDYPKIGIPVSGKIGIPVSGEEYFPIKMYIIKP